MIAVNIMVATRFYERYVRAAAEAGAELIISGAGLPARLPEFVRGTKACIAPIISSVKAARVILRLWDKKYKRVPDLVVVEGPLAGGHLGFSEEELAHIDMDDYDRELTAILETVQEYGDKYSVKIPVAVAGGIDSARKVNHYLSLGADAVQVATRFVTTQECDAPEAYKMAYIRAFKEDIRIVKSPVGMPGRAIYNDFIARVEKGSALRTAATAASNNASRIKSRTASQTPLSMRPGAISMMRFYFAAPAPGRRSASRPSMKSLTSSFLTDKNIAFRIKPLYNYKQDCASLPQEGRLL